MNAICKEINSVNSCICLPDYIGNPYDECRPECAGNFDCPANLACIKFKCQDPCVGVCGLNAFCQVVSHIPICSCNPLHTGDPFLQCIVNIKEIEGMFSILDLQNYIDFITL